MQTNKMIKLILFLSLLIMGQLTHANKGAGATVRITTAQGEQLDLYKNSYALLIEVSDYKNGWPDLNSIPGELDAVEAELKAQGFHVIRVTNPNEDQLKQAFDDFIDNYGYDEHNRLLFFYSGHGYSFPNKDKGYLVPVDAPNPNDDRKGFLRKALSMDNILTWARTITAKHALFLFDSCFSGSVFQSKGLLDVPPYISQLSAKPVRQFITAGSATDEVPAKSTFTPAFVDGLKYKLADMDGDGYITGMELGRYLQKVVPQSVRQMPQYGTIRDYELRMGDFIFVAVEQGRVKKPMNNGENTGGDFVFSSNKPILRLTVKTSPVEAKIRILNIERTYHAGIVLQIDKKYQIEIIAKGYKRQIKTVSYDSAGDKVLSIVLQEKGRTNSGIKQYSQNIVSNHAEKDSYTGMEFVRVYPGCFQSYKDNKFDRKICTTNMYDIGKYEVTQAQWRKVMGNNPSHNSSIFSDTDNFPVECVSWNDAQKFIKTLNKTLNKNTGLRYRLPTGAEWGNACGDRNYCSETKLNFLGYGKNEDTQVVGQKRANELGIHDMNNNVFEWVEDKYTSTTIEHPVYDRWGLNIHTHESELRNARALFFGFYSIRGGSDYDLHRCSGYRAGTGRETMGDFISSSLKDTKIGFRLVRVPLRAKSP